MNSGFANEFSAGQALGVTTTRQLNGNLGLLRIVIGEEQVDVPIQPSFPVKQLTDAEHLSVTAALFGPLSIRVVAHGAPRLGIPNQTVKHLMYGYLRDGSRDVRCSGSICSGLSG